MKVVQVQENDFDVINMQNQHKYQVSWSNKLGTYGCTCGWGTQEIGSGLIDEGKRCKHVDAIRQILGDLHAKT